MLLVEISFETYCEALLIGFLELIRKKGREYVVHSPTASPRVNVVAY